LDSCPLPGRWYVRKVRAASTDQWRGRVLRIALEQAELRTNGELPAPPAVVRSFVLNDSDAQLPDASDGPAESLVAVGVALGDADDEPPPLEENEDGGDGDDGEEVETAAQATAAAASSSVAVTALVEVTTLAAADVNKLKVVAIRPPSARHLLTSV
jgi:hypothetical protein